MLVTIARYSFPYEAQIARSRLQAQGVEAYVADEHTINMQWLYSDALGGVKVQVPAVDEVRARSILAEDLSIETEFEAFDSVPLPRQCNHCGSTRLEPYRQGKRTAFLMFLALQFPLWPTRDAKRCRDCGEVIRY
ncbi:DUF2007 domain-containing protein [Aestuariirhabdus sp. Z084]|uniref:putative signal transducing protein n=1 Tax=Aestuariirhabdus haliotis TaxID=2918751 RepID=UPI00201B3AAE|nr:DUF2007 domain-containing protein [Aestuariirhabdus haliotis]MCL6415712.1 DUF2007 domain-containing protein [Aestuariirhabdus haliotis]MCL6419762.1 DUF2007 domain-containing protein [Aestuariirhabdus haliotis]